ncbi:MAG: recombination mediator RecR [Verrucomicrobiales bacterium]|nr:recombination mediator RecR [Verrucomicrobiales bacterium]
MKPLEYPEPVKHLILQLKQLPGIGPKSAERITVWLLRDRAESVMQSIAQSLMLADQEVGECGVCGFFATSTGCAICDRSGRDSSVLCVVEQATDILPLEKSGAFQGYYHSLRGRISPLENVGPADIRIDALMSRLRQGAFAEVILALNSDVEGEATANYLMELMAPLGIHVTRLAQGLPAGGGLESADELTLLRALEGRRSM